MKTLKILSLIVMLLFTVSCSEKKDFNSDEWKNWTESESTMQKRWLMHKDLLQSYELKGVNKDSILNLLGKPNFESNSEYRYSLGATGRGINTGTMTITFENDVVTDIKVTDG